jgi:Beta-galactosidase
MPCSHSANFVYFVRRFKIREKVNFVPLMQICTYTKPDTYGSNHLYIHFAIKLLFPNVNGQTRPRAKKVLTMNKSYSYDSFLYGVVYYPEQWPETQWNSDLARIVQTGMNVVRMGEGAWSVWEPEEGRYDFALFDRALELCQRHGLKAIMGTPTYTPPAWLTERYPEVSRVSFGGTRLTHGSRRHYNYTSPIYQQRSRAITEALAEHYQAHPA